MRARLNLKSIKLRLFFCVALAVICFAACKNSGRDSDTGNQARSRQDSTDSAETAAPASASAQQGSGTDTDDGVVPALARPSVSGSVKIDSFTDSRDGKTYSAVKIGRQTWMAENLDYRTIGSTCYEGKAGNCERYGSLYRWSIAKDACPAGWHLPSDAEWTTLDKSDGTKGWLGTQLRSSAGWYDRWDGSGTDDYGFSALPGGMGCSHVFFGGAGKDGYWWTATEDDAKIAIYRNMQSGVDFVFRHYDEKNSWFSVRCVRDALGD